MHLVKIGKPFWRIPAKTIQAARIFRVKQRLISTTLLAAAFSLRKMSGVLRFQAKHGLAKACGGRCSFFALFYRKEALI
jgi:hypothetical protein